MNIKQYIWLIFIWNPIILTQSYVNFNIIKFADTDYTIKITLPSNINNALYGLIDEKNTITISPTKIAGNKKLIKLNEYILNNITNYLQSGSTINLTLDLSYLTTFNKAYRELYNVLRNLSKDQAHEILAMETEESPSMFNTFKRFFVAKELNPHIPILPDLAPQAWLAERAYQSHPQMTKAVGGTAAAGLVGAYVIKKLKQGGS